MISSDEVLRTGKDPRKTVRAPADWGYGDDAHLAQIDVVHQIHCLNMVRQAVYRDYYQSNTTGLYWTHVSHCLHLVLQNLMCSANVDVVTHNWVETQRNPFPDFSINHQCRDFEAVLQWQEENKVPDAAAKVTLMERPAESEFLPAPKKLLDLINF